MNVTLKLPDDLCREARHRAVDESKSLSAWVAALVERALVDPARQRDEPKTWMEAFSGDEDDEFLDRDFPLEDRKTIPNREFSFED